MRLWWADEDVFTPDGYWVEDEYSWPPRWTPDGEPVE
jgi:hypothetical protein